MLHSTMRTPPGSRFALSVKIYTTTAIIVDMLLECAAATDCTSHVPLRRTTREYAKKNHAVNIQRIKHINKSNLNPEEDRQEFFLSRGLYVEKWIKERPLLK